MFNLQQIRMALVEHAMTNDGRLPATLQQLSPDVIDGTKLPALGFRGPDPERDYDWLYLPRPNIKSLPPETILVASPTAFSGDDGQPERMVLRLDGTVKFIPDTEFQQIIAKQLKE